MEKSICFSRVDILKMEYLREKIDFYKSELFSLKNNDYKKNVLDVCKYYEKELSSLENLHNEISSFWENGLNKYYHVEFKNGFPYTEVYIFPYLITSSNAYMFGVLSFNDNYNSGMRDTSIEYDMFFKYDTCITEITKDEFIEACSKNIERPIEERLKKIITRKKNIKK